MSGSFRSGSFRSRSASQSASQSSRHSNSNHSNNAVPPPGPSLTPSHDGTFEACAATASFFLYAQRNIILCLHHDTLAIERRFERHREDVLWIAVDNVSERGNGRLVVSYDTSQTTIVWDLLTGDEVARFASYEEIRVAAWMKNSNIAFGNSQGNVILFEPATSEHISARTIFDPITALAPSTDCRTYAIGYMNGSILIANLQPAFTILHTLSSSRAPSPLNKLAWHGSSSKQKSDMLAAQTADGDLRVWSIPKSAYGDSPSIIRILSRTENDRVSGKNWFGWSKMGRIVQYTDGLTFVWDVRTKRVTYESVPTVDGLVGITNYAGTATLFTLGRNHTVQQYDLNPTSRPMLVQNVQHVPAKLPPSPPISDGDQGKPARYTTASASGAQQVTDRPNSNLPLYLEVENSEGEGEATMSPLARIVKGDQADEELRDKLGPLSPVSSRASTTSRSSRGGGGGGGGGGKKQQPLHNFRPSGRSEGGYRPASPGMVSNSGQSSSSATTFSMGASSYKGGSYQQRATRESISTRSLLSTSTSSKSSSKISGLRQEVLRSPEETKNTMSMELFPYTKARLSEVRFRPPQYDQNRRTTDDLRVQMLNVVFGWTDDIDSLIRDELCRHPSGSASGVMLSKWLGDLGADIAASMIGSESMTSADWMLLALSSMGHDSQKKVGEAFVQRLLEKGDIHPAVAILLGLGEYDDAVEVYVSRKYYMEAVLLTCLYFRSDWQRQSFLVRKWGEVAVSEGQPELAVRCFSCTGMESSEPWFSPRAQDAVYAAQQNILGPDTPPSTSAASPSSPQTGRLHPSQAGLKLVTSFVNTSNTPKSAVDEKTPMVYPGETPIDTVISPEGPLHKRPFREPASAMSTRTATPGGYGRKRLPSSSRTGSTRTAADLITPNPDTANTVRHMTAIKGSKRRESEASSTQRTRSVSASQTSSSFLTTSTYQPGEERGRFDLPSPAQGVFARLTQQSHIRNGSRERKPEGLLLSVEDVVIDPSLPSGTTQSSHTYITAGSPSTKSTAQSFRHVATTPSLSSNVNLGSAKIKSIDSYISGLDEASYGAVNTKRAESRSRETNRDLRPTSRTTQRAPSESRGRTGTRYIRPAKRSPSSPVSMSPDDPALQTNNQTFDDERFYKLASPIEPTSAKPREREQSRDRERDRSRGPGGRATSRAKREPSTDGARRKRSRSRPNGGAPKPASRQNSSEELLGEGRGRSKVRGQSSGTRSPSSPRPMSPAESTQTSKSKVGERVRERSMSRRPRSPSASARKPSPDPSTGGRKASRPPMPRLQTNLSDGGLTAKKALAQQELEARRLSLARRPSAPPIVHPDELIPKSAVEAPNDQPFGPFGIPHELELIRGHTADPHVGRKLGSSQAGTSTKSVPIGLPATPRAMRHPKYMGDGDGGDVPAVPEIPANFGQNMSEIPEDRSQDVLTLLPASTFSPHSGPSRSMSAPPEKLNTMSHQRRGSVNSQNHSHQNSDNNDITVVLPSPNGVVAFSKSIDATIRESQVIVLNHSSHESSSESQVEVIPQLQHLFDPPPPPPPPVLPPAARHGPTHSLGVINISIEDQDNVSQMGLSQNNTSQTNLSRQATPVMDLPREANAEASTSQGHRRGRGSVSESMSSKLRGVRDRLRDRSGSRNRTMTASPPVPSYNPMPYESQPQNVVQPRPTLTPTPYENVPQNVVQPRTGYTPSPYENIPQTTVQPRRQPSLPPKSRTPMPYETAIAQTVTISSGSASENHSDAPSQEQSTLPSTAFNGYRNPKDIARQMTQEQMRFGADISRQDTATAPPRTMSVYNSGYRNPREIRANMPPGQLQPGVEEGKMI